MKRVYLYKRFERFWHWCQALLVILLALTGFDIHYSLGIFDFERAVMMHRGLAWAFIVLMVFAVFWHFTTGEWKQYIPTRKFLAAMVQFYLLGIFKNAPHPVHKTQLSKLNPLQRLAYLGLKIILIPGVVLSGLLYYFYNHWEEMGVQGITMGHIAFVHTLCGYILLAFMFGHIYLTTTGQSPLSNLKAMITGWEELSEDSAIN